MEDNKQPLTAEEILRNNTLLSKSGLRINKEGSEYKVMIKSMNEFASSQTKPLLEDIEKLKDNFTAASFDCEQAESKVESLNDEIEYMKANYNVLNSAFALACEDVKKHLEEIETYKELVKTYDMKVAEVETELTTYKRVAEEKMEEMDRLKQTKETFRVDNVNLLEEISKLKEEIIIHNKDLEDAAGELLLELPVPGSDMAKMFRANRIMRNERDENWNKVCELEQSLSLSQKENAEFIEIINAHNLDVKEYLNVSAELTSVKGRLETATIVLNHANALSDIWLPYKSNCAPEFETEAIALQSLYNEIIDFLNYKNK